MLNIKVSTVYLRHCIQRNSHVYKQLSSKQKFKSRKNEEQGHMLDVKKQMEHQSSATITQVMGPCEFEMKKCLMYLLIIIFCM